ncbi:divisome protein SepX/GlpR [Corynebacterium auris]|uniref:divisome protein SepX/GlpR n=1 Tax=Corynebacterium auris TaxID=44750 RepID=UPI0025B5954E|nr:gephyrin-like molybdotransferase receptor GlpR [Corynebacterium auris]WJY67632.1 hypothetical protein CAURIS_03565 [Corynebacterium auris]
MGSLSLVIVLIIVVWAIVLAPMVMGNNKPIRRSGEGYEETRVLHSGGTAPVPGRRRPRLTRADVHRFEEDTQDYEVVEVEGDAPEREGGVSLRGFFARRDEPLEGEVVEDEAVVAANAPDAEDAADSSSAADAADEPDASGSTAYSLLLEEEEEQGPYALEDSYVSPADYGYVTEDYAAAAGESADGEHSALPEAAEDEAPEESEELTDEEIEFARARRGRGGWDPDREQDSKEDRFKRRQRTLGGLIIADVLAFVAAFVLGGWVWLVPVATIALTVWFMVALRQVVREERALHARRVRQLRRARMGVVTAGSSAGASPFRRPPGAVMVERDDESPDFDDLPLYAGEPSERPTGHTVARAS